ncbi:MAG TPA: SUMF1/EgtB/PvdO family nonheme iron enzyme [Nitrospiraceae bacterium]|jgi:formylglycine-generating enzyme required for sulfatase activity|nr:SUMF1/EgtB/PvdO family nonheme iron enzyme [Nitrospiraceae bacterium]
MKRSAWLTLAASLAIAGGLPFAGAAERLVLPAEKPAGSGVIVHTDGYVLTAHHVVSNARRIMVVTPGEFRAPAILVSADPEHDLALLKIETVGLSEAALGYAGAVRLDQEVIAVGFPFGLREVSVTRGRVAAVRTKGVQRVFQVDAAVNPGNSGGPLFNRRGEVIGIVTTKFSHPSGIVPEGMAFAVPISYATPLLANIPDFDFTLIGKGGKERKTKGGGADLVQELMRATVRIETVRAAEAPPAAQASHQPSGRSAKAETTPPPAARTSPTPPQGRPPTGDDEPEITKVNQQLQAAQQEELRKLAQQGISPPEGMVLIPAGEFLMGAEDGLPDSRPMHRVYLSSYWLDKYEVTNAQYRQCVEGGGCTPPKDRQAFDDPERAQHPVTNVTWMQARTYCEWRGKRLPTEAEWEKAARGTDGRRYPWGNSEEMIKGRPKNGEIKAGANGTEQIGSQAATVSPYGVHDLVGSVWEWVKDWYAEDFYQMSPARDPQGPLRGSFRVLRGGDWNERPLELRVSYRSWDEMTYWGPTLGFRCAQDVP